MEAEVAETTSTLSRLEANLAELELTKAGHDAAIATARGLCDQYTKSDVLRLRDELDAVQAMHGWTVESVELDRMRLVYGGELVLSVPLGSQGQVEVEYRKAGIASAGKVGAREKADKAMGGLKEVFMSAVNALDVQTLGVATVSCRVLCRYYSSCILSSTCRRE
jgi:kinetochore protein Spc7/SPC105